MSLAFLGLDDDLDLCPSCNRKGSLVYTSFSKSPVGCEPCLILRKAKGLPSRTWEMEAEKQKDDFNRAIAAVKDLATIWAGEKQRKKA